MNPAPPQLPQPPRHDRWPVAVQHAMRLRGALVPCGPGLRGVGWPDTPRVRLQAIADALTGGHIAAFLTAAWVWFATPEPGEPLSVAKTAGLSRCVHSSETRRYELRLSPAEVVMLGEFGVTAPLRTILDLMHLSPEFGPTERAACHELLQLTSLSIGELGETLSTQTRPGVKIARERFREFAQEPLPEPLTTLP